MGPVLLAVGLVLYNSLANLWRPFQGWAYVPMNVALAAGVGWIGLGPLGLTAAEIGFGEGWAGDLAVGILLGMAIAAPVLAAALHPRTARWVSDERVGRLRGGMLAYQVLIRVPVGTAFLEELAFRGVLYGAWRPRGAWWAAVATAIPFGLWHVAPTLNLVRANRPGAGPRETALVISGAVTLTFAAGLGFAALRASTGTIGTPLGLHAALNSLATLGSVAASRRAAPVDTD